MDINVDSPQNLRMVDGHAALVQKFLLNFVDLQYDDPYSLRNNKNYVRESPASIHAQAWSDAVRVKHRLAERDPVWRTIHLRVKQIDFADKALRLDLSLTFSDGAQADVTAYISGWVENDSETFASDSSEGGGDSAAEFGSKVAGETSEQSPEGNSDTGRA